MSPEQERRWQVIGRRYLARIIHQTAEVREFLDDMDRCTTRRLGTLGNTVRQIAGTASLFGYQEVAGLAGRLSLAIENPVAADRSTRRQQLLPVFRELEAAVREVAAAHH